MMPVQDMMVEVELGHESASERKLRTQQEIWLEALPARLAQHLHKHLLHGCVQLAV